ncbi:MAG TPA: hypothetical protein VH643_00265 [Gemmataceae bacterium]
MRQASVDARGKNNRVEQFHVVPTMLDASGDGDQIDDLSSRRCEGEVAILSIQSTMRMDILHTCDIPLKQSRI